MSQRTRTVAEGLRDIRDLAADLTRQLERAGLDGTKAAYLMTVRIRDEANALLTGLERPAPPP
jgi:hypothetical protein